MNCTNQDQDTCNVEKMGCKGCAYYDYEDVIEELVRIENRLNQLSREHNLKLNIDTLYTGNSSDGKYTRILINVFKELR